MDFKQYADYGFRYRSRSSSHRKYGAPEIINTDQGCHFTSDEYTMMVKGYGIRHSMDGKGRATDNIAIYPNFGNKL